MNAFFTLGILGLVEGLTEFVPVSSSGHLIIARELLGATGPLALGADAVLQLGAALALVIYFWKDLIGLLYTLLYKITGRPVKPEEMRLLWALIIGTVPGVVLGLFLEKTMDTVFRNTHLVAYALVAGSLLMVAGEWFSRQGNRTGIEGIGWVKGLSVGLFQALAVIPGVSRSGSTISGGLLLGLTREAAARFSFILSIPIIFGAGAKKFLELSQSGGLSGLGWPLFFGAVIAFISGLAVIHWLMRFLRTRTLYSFAVYRVLVAVVILLFIPPL